MQTILGQTTLESLITRPIILMPCLTSLAGGVVHPGDGVAALGADALHAVGDLARADLLDGATLGDLPDMLIADIETRSSGPLLVGVVGGLLATDRALLILSLSRLGARQGGILAPPFDHRLTGVLGGVDALLDEGQAGLEVVLRGGGREEVPDLGVGSTGLSQGSRPTLSLDVSGGVIPEIAHLDGAPVWMREGWISSADAGWSG